MQTKQQIQQLLASAGASVNKRLGQHFLIDLNLMRLLIDSADIDNNDVVLEVGCGTGSLTEGLAEYAGYCLAVEYDRALTEIAKKQLERAKNVEIINTDILKNKNTINQIVLDKLSTARKKHTGRILLVANLPYNVASPVMLNLVTGTLVADGMYVTVQKQVAERMAAVPACLERIYTERSRSSRRGSRHYGILSILLGATGEVKLIRILRPTVFWPQPKVDSAIVRFIRNEEKVSRIKDIKLFSEIVGFFMGHRRKTLMACSKFASRRVDLGGGRIIKKREARRSPEGKLAEIDNWPEIFERCHIDPKQRPEQLSSEEYIAIANLS